MSGLSDYSVKEMLSLQGMRRGLHSEGSGAKEQWGGRKGAQTRRGN